MSILTFKIMEWKTKCCLMTGKASVELGKSVSKSNIKHQEINISEDNSNVNMQGKQPGPSPALLFNLTFANLSITP